MKNLTTLKFAGLVTLMLQSGMAGESPSFAWAQSAGGVSIDYAVAAAIDEAGNSFLGARLRSNPATLGDLSITNECVVVAKFNTAGALQWSVELTPASNVSSLQMGTDQAGNCYAAGQLAGSISVGSSNLIIAPGTADLFLAKFSPEGNVLWAIAAGSGNTTNQTYEPSLFVERNGECLLSGWYHGEFVIGTNRLGFPGASSRPFVARSSVTGDWLWAMDPCVTSNSASVWPKCILGETSGNYYVGGYFAGGVQFGNQVLTNSNHGAPDLFLVKCDPLGNVIWAKGGQDCAPLALAADSSGSCYVLGGRFDNYGSFSFDGCVVTNAGMFLVKLDPMGNVIWCRNSADMGHEPLVSPAGTWRLAMDAADQLYVAGYFYGTAVLGNLTITNRGGAWASPSYFASSFLAKYDATGTAIWVKDFGGGNPEYTFPIDYPYDKIALAVNSEGRCCIVGAITMTNALFDGFVLATAGSEDAFIAQLNPERPTLGSFRTGAGFVLNWPTNQPSYSLEKSPSLVSGNWSPVTNSILTAGIQRFVTNSIEGESWFFRLRRP